MQVPNYGPSAASGILLIWFTEGQVIDGHCRILLLGDD